MAIIRIDHTPSTTKVMQALNIIVPEPGRMEGTPVRERKVLYLLHGLSDDATAWQRYTSIETVALEYGLVVVMTASIISATWPRNYQLTCSQSLG